VTPVFRLEVCCHPAEPQSTRSQRRAEHCIMAAPALGVHTAHISAALTIQMLAPCGRADTPCQNSMLAQVPKRVTGVPSEILQPSTKWSDGFQDTLCHLATLLAANFNKCGSLKLTSCNMCCAPLEHPGHQSSCGQFTDSTSMVSCQHMNHCLVTAGMQQATALLMPQQHRTSLRRGQCCRRADVDRLTTAM
jgi:hypothetical protein